MSPFSAAATAPISSRNQDPVASSQLERVLEFQSARWLPSLLSDLRSLELNGENIAGVGDFRVAHSTADNLRRLLTVISGLSLPEPKLSPFSGGGIALTCGVRNKELTVTAYPNHDDFVISVTAENDDLEDHILTLDQSAQIASLFATFLA